MRGLIQRVSRASVSVDKKRVGEIGAGLLLFVGIARDDKISQADALLDKVLAYRIFSETGEDGKTRMNRSLSDTHGDLLIVSQFTLVADTQKGLRPGFSSAASPLAAEELFGYLLEQARVRHGDGNGGKVSSGIFGADMQVELVNDGPVTFLLEN